MKRSWTAGVLGLVMLSGVAGGTVSAQQATSPRAENVFTMGRSSLTMMSIVDGDRYELSLDDGEVERVTVNGLELPDEQVRVNEDGHYEILDEAGEVLTEFRVSMAGPRWVGIGDDGAIGIAGVPRPQLLERARVPAIQAVVGPRVIIGIQHAEPDAQLRTFMGLEEGEARVVMSVLDGMPAEKAGLKPFDVIVAIDGKAPVTSELLTKILSEKEPGETIKLKVIRKGEERVLGVETVARGAGGNIAVVEGFPGRFVARGDEDARQRFEMEADRLRREAERLARQGERFELLLPRMLEQGNDDRFRLLFNRDQFDAMEQDAEAMAEELEMRIEDLVEAFENRFEEFDEFNEDREEEIEDRMEELEERLEERFDELEDRLEALIERLERREVEDRRRRSRSDDS